MHNLHKILKFQVREFKGFNTKMLQIESLVQCMDAYGYNVSMDSSCGTMEPTGWDRIHNFYKVKDDNSSSDNPEFLSFSTALSIHNGVTVRVMGDKVDFIGTTEGLFFDTATMIKGKKAKLVRTAKLQRLKGGDIICQSNFVDMVNV